MRPSFALLFTCGLLAATCSMAADMRPERDPAKASQAVSDVTIDFFDGKQHNYEYIAPDGTSRSRDAEGKLKVGRWHSRPDGTICFVHDDPKESGCVYVARSKKMMQFYRIDGVIEGPFPWASGNVKGL